MQTRSKRNITVVEDPNEVHIIKRMKQSYGRAQQEEAFRELLKLIGANGGKIPYGAMDKLVKTCNKNGFTAVTRDNLNYRLKKYKNSPPLIGNTVSVSNETHGVLSDLTNASTSFENGHDKDIADAIEKDQINSVIESIKVNVGGRKKGSTKAAAAAMRNKLKDIVTQCCHH